MLSCCLVALLPHCLAVLLPCYLAALLPSCLIVSLPRCLPISLARCFIAWAPHQLCALPPQFPTPLVPSPFISAHQVPPCLISLPFMASLSSFLPFCPPCFLESSLPCFCLSHCLAAQLPGWLVAWPPYRLCASPPDFPLHSGLSLRAGGRGFSPATTSLSPGYFDTERKYWKEKNASNYKIKVGTHDATSPCD